jgi:hypothetical protein
MNPELGISQEFLNGLYQFIKKTQTPKIHGSIIVYKDLGIAFQKVAL